MRKPRDIFGTIFANILALCAIGAVGTGIYISYLFVKKINSLEDSIWDDHTLLGMAGEFIGGTVGSIWALAGVILFFLALIYQKKELELQRIELHENRKIMDSQSKTIAIQQFENTFFQLLNFHINAAVQIRNTYLTISRKQIRMWHTAVAFRAGVTAPHLCTAIENVRATERMEIQKNTSN